MGPEARVCLVLWDRIKKMASEKKKQNGPNGVPNLETHFNST